MMCHDQKSKTETQSFTVVVGVDPGGCQKVFFHVGDRLGNGYVAVMQAERYFIHVPVRIGVEMVEASGIESAGAANQAMDFISQTKEQFREVGTVLAGDASD